MYSVYGHKAQYYRTDRSFDDVIADYKAAFNELGWKHTIGTNWGQHEEKKEIDSFFYVHKQQKFVSVSRRSNMYPYSLYTNYIVDYEYRGCTE